MQVIFNTGNAGKFLNAKAVCTEYGIEVVQKTTEPDEIQSEDPKKVAIDKANKVFAELKHPVIITDDSWQFIGLNGFPGVYMHSMNEWLAPEDFLRLTLPLKDRRVVLTQYLIYTTKDAQKVFVQKTEGTLLKEVRGESPHPSHTIISMEGDNGLTIAEALDGRVDRSKRQSAQIWHNFAQSITEKRAML